jgi:hypothetical protein
MAAKPDLVTPIAMGVAELRAHLASLISFSSCSR